MDKRREPRAPTGPLARTPSHSTANRSVETPCRYIGCSHRLRARRWGLDQKCFWGWVLAASIGPLAACSSSSSGQSSSGSPGTASGGSAGSSLAGDASGALSGSLNASSPPRAARPRTSSLAPTYRPKPIPSMVRWMKFGCTAAPSPTPRFRHYTEGLPTPGPLLTRPSMGPSVTGHSE